MDIPYIFHIYFLNMFHIFSLVCFLIYGVKSRSGHDRSKSFGPISDVSGPKLTFWGNFLMILHGFVWRNLENIAFASKNDLLDVNTERDPENKAIMWNSF